MDPLSILSVAAAAVQFLDFGSRVLVDTRETYRSSLGRKQNNIELSTVANDIRRLMSDVESKLSGFTFQHDEAALRHTDGDSRQRGNATKDTLIRLCHQAEGIGSELQVMLDKLQARGKTSLGLAASSFITVLKGICSDEKIQDLKKRLDETQKQIMMEIMVLTWVQAEENRVTTNEFARQQAHSLTMLNTIDKTTRNFGRNVMDILQGHTREGRIQAQQIEEYALDSKWQPSEQIGGMTRHSDAGVCFDKNKWLAEEAVAESLRFETIHSREESIPEAYTNTYRWIFQRPRFGDDGTPLWSDFSRWLSSTSNDVYWITGKPGAGKSTLIKFIVADAMLETLLARWAGPAATARLATYYSWNAGNELQKSHEGLLRTLLYQSITRDPAELVPVIFPGRLALCQLFGSPLRLPEWSMGELVAGFKALLSQAGRKLSDEKHPFKLAIIIDGLDEFETGYHTPLVELLQEASTYPDVKICVSSRPWNIFRDAFRQKPMLQLENLTRQDIRDYANGRLQNSQGFQERSALQPLDAKNIINDILEKARGVFLWVSVVVRELLVRLQEGDKLSDLRQAVNRLQEDLSTLYQLIWDRVNPQYHGEAAQYFSVLELYHKHSLVPYAMSFWLGDDENTTGLRIDMESQTFVDSATLSLKRRLSSRTRGLLDIYSGQTRGDDRVDYAHRTVKEWVDKNWDHISPTIDQDLDAGLWILKAKTLRFHEPAACRDFYDRIAHLCEVAVDVRDTPSTNTELVRILDKLDAKTAMMWGPREPEHGTEFKYGHLNFLGLMAQIPVTNYLKAKLAQDPRDPDAAKTTKPNVSVFLCAIIGCISSSHPLKCRSTTHVCRIPERLALIEFLLPLTPLHQVKGIVRMIYPYPGCTAPEFQNRYEEKMMPALEKLLQEHLQVRKESKTRLLSSSWIKHLVRLSFERKKLHTKQATN
ncbi:hypothetical protein GGR52DRAFT_409525 [Hypoxylon sp. FL1284]|nr:hypothetical protein GGR52DRAFT_409525 [Hypoxylon sp. FL1284]